VRRSIRNSHVEADFSFGDGLVFLLGLLLCVFPILGIKALSKLSKKELKGAIAFGAPALLLGVATPVVGYLSGSVISLDNPTSAPVQISVDGTRVDVPAGSFTEVRATGPTVEIRTETAGQVVEQVALDMDDHVGQTLLRVFLGDGRYVYTVCGLNRFSEGHYGYE